MIKPAGIIQRIAREPEIHLEFLSSDIEGELQWSRKEAEALWFDDYHAADTRAHQLGGRPIFAVSRPARGNEAADPDRFVFDDQVQLVPRRRHIRKPRRAHAITGASPNNVAIYA